MEGSTFDRCLMNRTHTSAILSFTYASCWCLNGRSNETEQKSGGAMKLRVNTSDTPLLPNGSVSGVSGRKILVWYHKPYLRLVASFSCFCLEHDNGVFTRFTVAGYEWNDIIANLLRALYSYMFN